MNNRKALNRVQGDDIEKGRLLRLLKKQPRKDDGIGGRKIVSKIAK